jgi:uncharacterized protein involved in exopolysaccharide biosynthesis
LEEREAIKRLFHLLISSWWIVALSLILGYLAGYLIIRYTNVQYISSTTIHLDDNRKVSNIAKDVIDGNLFKTEMSIQSQVELIKSPELVKKTIIELGLDVTYYRVGEIKTSNCYQESPFRVIYEKENFTCYNIPFEVEIISESRYNLKVKLESEEKISEFGFGELVLLNGCVFSLRLNRDVSDNQQFDLIDSYRFIVTEPNLLSNQISKKLLAKSITKNVPVIELIFKHEVPELASEFLNAHTEIYIEDYVSRKGENAKSVKTFFDIQLDTAKSELMVAESNLQRFKSTYGVVNTKQETQKSLSAISNLQEQRQNVILEISAAEAFRADLLSENIFGLTYAPSADYGNILHAEQVKRLQLLLEKQREYSLLYTDRHEKMHELKGRINTLKDYLLNSLHTTIITKEDQWKKLDFMIENEAGDLTIIPERESIQASLERELKLKEEACALLYERSLYAGVQSSSQIVGHRVLKKAIPARRPISPNKSITYAICLTLSLFSALAIIFLGPFMLGRLTRLEQLSESANSVVFGSIEEIPISKRLISEGAKRVVSRLNLEVQDIDFKKVLVTSTVDNEGVSSTALQIAKVYGARGKRVGLIDINNSETFTLIEENKPDIRSNNSLGKKTKFEGVDIIKLTEDYNCFSLSNAVKDLLKNLKKEYEVIVIDSLPTANRYESIQLIEDVADAVVYVTRKNKTKLNHIRYANQLVKTYGIKSLGFVFLSGRYDVGDDGTVFSKFRNAKNQYLPSSLRKAFG